MGRADAQYTDGLKVFLGRIPPCFSPAHTPEIAGLNGSYTGLDTLFCDHRSCRYHSVNSISPYYSLPGDIKIRKILPVHENSGGPMGKSEHGSTHGE